MFQLSVVHLDAGKNLIFNNLYIIHDSFENKWWQDVLNFITTRDRLIDWLFSYDQDMLFSEVCECQRDFNKCCRNLLFNIYIQLIFLKIIHKSEASYLCCYQRRSYTESIESSFSTQYLCPKFFNVRDCSGRFQN